VPPDPPQPPAQPGKDLALSIADWFGTVFKGMLRVLADAEGAPHVLGELGWTGTAPVLPGQLLSLIDGSAASGTSSTASAAETFAELIVGLATLGEAIVTATATDSVVGALAVVGDMLDLAMTAQLKRDKPLAWAILRLLNLLADDGLSIPNLAALFSDAHSYLSGLTSSSGYEQSYQDYSLILAAIGVGLGFIPDVGEHGPNGTSFRSEVLYGWTNPNPNPQPNLSTLLARTLTWRLDGQVAASDSSPAGAEQTFDLTFALVPPQHHLGSWGLFVRLAGATTFTIPIGTPKVDPATHEVTPTGWQLTIASTDGGAVEMLFGNNGFIRATSTGFKASIAIERPDAVSGSWLLGASSGTHLEIQHARLAFTLAEDAQGTLFDVLMGADHIIVNIALGGDSLISSVLPRSLRIDTKLGLGVDTRRGVYLTGGVALVVDLPVNIDVGIAGVFDFEIQAMHLRIGFSTADSSSDPSNASFQVAVTVDAGVKIAGDRVSATVSGIGAAFNVTKAPPAAGSSGPAGNWTPSLAFVPPHGLGMVVDATVIKGGGFISFDPDRGEYAGALQLKISLASMNIEIVALGMLNTKIPDHDGDWALLLIMSVTFEVLPIQLGLGFAMFGIGAVIGYNHSLDSDAIAAGLRTKALDAILFPPDPVAQAPHIFATWRQTMPVAVGHMVLGLMLRIGWGGVKRLATLDLGLLFTWGEGDFEIVLLGRFEFVAPLDDVAIVKIRADVMGRLKFDPVDFLLQAELVDSKIGTFLISGGLVIAARGGPDGTFVLSIGGFHPHFTPPPRIPVPDRIRVDISGSDNPRLRLEAYIAVTSQTFQFGARAELHAAAGPLSLDGWLGLDVLIQWLPKFFFSCEISAGVSLSYDNSPVLELSIDVLLEGPGPWHVKGYASLTLLFFTVSLPIDKTWGDDDSATSQTAQPLDMARDALSNSDAWTAQPPEGRSTMVSLREPVGSAIPAHPMATVSCHQRVVPLGLSITHVGKQPLSAPTTVDIVSLNLGGSAATDTAPVVEQFAAGQFLSLSDADSLSRPSFEPMRAGIAAGGSAVDIGGSTAVATSYKTVLVDGTQRNTRPRWLLDVAHADAVLRPSAPVTARPMPPTMATVSDTLRTFAGGTGPETATMAAQHAGGARLLDLVGIAGATP